MTPSLPRLSVLDLAIVGAGSDPAAALDASTRQARRAEELGYHRYWVAEHHSMPGIASSQPAVLLAHLGAHTERIRLGSGGVMLPNHSPLVVAEQFGMLEALHPGRIDLGLGRAPGTDGITAAALRRTNQPDTGDEFPHQLGELFGYFQGTIPDTHPFSRIRATPGLGLLPEVWLLGSSSYSAILAGRLGLPFSFAHHFAGDHTDEAVAAYLDAFTPGADRPEPELMLGVAVLCAPTDDEAAFLAGASQLAMARLRAGHPDVYPTPEEAAAHDWTPTEDRVRRHMGRHQVVGSPATVVAALSALAERTGAHELMLTTPAHGPDHRVRSLELVAAQTALAPR